MELVSLGKPEGPLHDKFLCCPQGLRKSLSAVHKVCGNFDRGVDFPHAHVTGPGHTVPIQPRGPVATHTMCQRLASPVTASRIRARQNGHNSSSKSGCHAVLSVGAILGRRNLFCPAPQRNLPGGAPPSLKDAARLVVNRGMVSGEAGMLPIYPCHHCTVYSMWPTRSANCLAASRPSSTLRASSRTCKASSWRH